MPANPDHVDNTVELSEDYHDDKATIDFYSNSAVAIGRNREDAQEGVWLDNLEKRELYAALKKELE